MGCASSTARQPQEDGNLHKEHTSHDSEIKTYVEPDAADADGQQKGLGSGGGGGAQVPNGDQLSRALCRGPLCRSLSRSSARERERLDAVAVLLDNQPGDRFAPITGLLRTAFDVPLAFVTLLHDESLYSTAGPTPTEWASMPREDAMCEWVLRQTRPELIIVEDLSQDARFQDLPAVKGAPHMRFYASAPLVSTGASSLVYGTLCVVDFKPRSFQPAQYQMLAHFASLVVSEYERDLELARGEDALKSKQAELQSLTAGFDGASDAVVVCHVTEEGWPVVYSNPAATKLLRFEAQAPDTPFWRLFSPAGPQQESAEAARALVAQGQPFTLTCQPTASLLSAASGQAGAPADANGGLARRRSDDGARLGDKKPSVPNAPNGADGPRPSSDSPRSMTLASQLLSSRSGTTTAASGTVPISPQSSSLAAVLAGADPDAASHATLAVTFAPCNSSVLTAGVACLPDAPALAIPAGSGVREGSSEAGDAPPSALCTQPYWFATLRSMTAAARVGLLTAGSLPSAGTLSHEAGGLHMMGPEEMKGVTLGPLLGSGAYGRTFRGTWKGSRVAVKVIEMREEAGSDGSSGGGTPYWGGSLPGSGASAGPGSAPVVEALLTKALAHPHIVVTHAFGVLEQRSNSQSWKECWIVQELCTGGTLAKAVETGRFRNPATGAPRLGFVLRTAVEIAGALAYLHSNGVLHADLNGNNILLTASPNDQRGFVAKVADFGLSRPLDVLSTLTTGTYGTVSHMPPELIIDGQLTTAADIFSFGVVFWEMMSGRRAWEGMNALQIVNAVTVQGKMLDIPATWPQRLQNIMQRCLDVEPQSRPSAKQLLAELQGILDGGGAALAAREPAAADAVGGGRAG